MISDDFCDIIAIMVQLVNTTSHDTDKLTQKQAIHTRSALASDAAHTHGCTQHSPHYRFKLTKTHHIPYSATPLIRTSQKVHHRKLHESSRGFPTGNLICPRSSPYVLVCLRVLCCVLCACCVFMCLCCPCVYQQKGGGSHQPSKVWVCIICRVSYSRKGELNESTI